MFPRRLTSKLSGRVPTHDARPEGLLISVEHVVRLALMRHGPLQRLVRDPCEKSKRHLPVVSLPLA
jgi:hypothetical protein